MNDKKLSDLELLEQDVWLNFCYFYQCDLLIKLENSLYTDHFEKIIKRMQLNDFPVSERLTSFMEMMGDVFSIPFKPFQIAQLLMRINTLRLEVNHLSVRVLQRQYSEILIAYVDTLGGFQLIQNQKLSRSAKGLLAVKARYDKHLYPRREIIYRILREQVARRGKWKTLNQAINFVLDDLNKAFEVYDVEWLQSELILKQKMLSELEQSKTSAKQTNVEFGSVCRKPRTASTSKKIVDLKKELNDLKQILKSKYPSKEMEKFKYRMPYSGGYVAETIIHELRTQPELLREILSMES